MTNETTPIQEAPKPSDGKLGREVHIFASERTGGTGTSNNLVALLAAGCTVLGVIVGFSLGMVAGSRSAHTGPACPAVATAAPVLAASPAAVVTPTVAKAKQGPGFLGIQFVSHREIGGGSGAYITEVFSGTVAARAGFQIGDVVTGVDDHVIRTKEQLVRAIWTHQIGDPVTISFVRDGTEHLSVVVLGKIPAKHQWRFKKWQRARGK